MNFNFNTDRLSVSNYSGDITNSDKDIVKEIIEILTPNVTKSLPKGWQNITTKPSAKKWIKERNEESIFLIIESTTSSEVIGFIFLYPIYLEDNNMDLRFGYLLSESFWGKGIGTELVKGIVKKCHELGSIKTISGGVEKDNIGSIKVLEKCGFHALSQEEKTKNVIFYEKRIPFQKNHIKSARIYLILWIHLSFNVNLMTLGSHKGLRRHPLFFFFKKIKIKPKGRPQSCRYVNQNGDSLLWGYAQITSTARLKFTLNSVLQFIKLKLLSSDRSLVHESTFLHGEHHNAICIFYIC